MKKMMQCLLELILIGLCGAALWAQEAKKFDFEGETPGAEAKAFSSVVGQWHIDKDGANIVYAVDGRKWERGTMANGLADKAKGLYGERYSEFLDNIGSYNYYPLSICKDIPEFKSGTLMVRFKGARGRIDQNAGIAFNIKPNGEYLVVRGSCLEKNMILWKCENGVRSSLQWVRNVPIPSNQWHTLKVIASGKKIKGYLDGKKYIDYTNKEDIDGKIGLWSKADSYVLFDDFVVEPAH